MLSVFRAPRRLFWLAALLSAMLLAAPAAASAAPQQFSFQAASLYVSEAAGGALVTVTRNPAAALVGGQVRYITLGEPAGTAVDPWDFTSQQGRLDFPAGAAAETFTVPIVNHGYNGMDKTIQLSLYGAAPDGTFGDYQKATLTINDNDPVFPRLASNPLMLPVPTSSDPLQGAKFFVDPLSQQAAAAKTHPTLNVIAFQPLTSRFGSFSYPDAGTSAQRLFTRAQYEEPGTIPLISTYRILDGHCGKWTPTTSEVAGYHTFIDQLSEGIGSYPGVLFLEIDSLITMPCLSSAGQRVRLGELSYAINTLTAKNPHLVIYLDAGAGDALPPKVAARYLRKAGVSKIQGFFLNATHFDWTSAEIAYGEKISKLLHGKHFVVNTAANGQGPEVPKNQVKGGNEQLCNPTKAGLGPKPTAYTGYPNVDMFAWIGNPGELGDGKCAGNRTKNQQWSAAYAALLVKNADFAVR